MTVEEKISKLREYCNTALISNLLNKYDFRIRDVYPYKPCEAFEPEFKKGIFGISSLPIIERPLVGQTGWDMYKPENIKGKQIHYMQILKSTMLPHMWVTFEQYINR